MNKLQEAAKKRDEEGKRLENTMRDLAKELYRLQGKPYFEPAVPELETKIKGRG